MRRKNMIKILTVVIFLLNATCLSVQAKDFTRKDFQYSRMSNAEFEELINRQSKIQPSSYRDMSFGGELNLANGGRVHLFTKNEKYLQMTLKFIDMLEEMGVDLIQFYFAPETWQDPKIEGYYDKVVEKIRKDNKKLFLGFQLIPKGANHGFKYNSFEEYRMASIRVIEETAKKYKPDYYSVVVEPHTNERWGGFDASDKDWAGLVLELSKIVKSVSPGTKTVATVTPLELDLMREFSGMDSIDVLGINTYRETLFVDKVIKTIDELSSKKPICIPETWIVSTANAPTTSAQEAKFLKSVLNFCQTHNIYAITPWYSNKFLTNSGGLTQERDALARGERTEAFYAYKDFIHDMRKKLPETGTGTVSNIIER